MQPTAPLAVVALLLVWLVAKAGFIGASAWLAISHPELLAQTQQVYRNQRGRCYLFGVINGGLTILIILVLLSNEVLALLGIILIASLLGALVVAYATGYADLGQSLRRPGVEHTLLRNVIDGGVIAETAFFTPVVGQILSILMLFRGLGAVVIAMLARRRATRHASAPLADTPSRVEPQP